MITHVAIKSNHDGNVYKLPKPNRHCHVIAMLVKSGFPKPVTGTQGFTTDNGIFMDRKEAAIYAITEGQINELQWTKDNLFSEDLW